MTLTLVTLTITGSLTLTQFSRSSTATATAPLFCSRPPLRGLGAQPPMPVSLRLRQPSLPSHALSRQLYDSVMFRRLWFVGYGS